MAQAVLLLALFLTLADLCGAQCINGPPMTKGRTTLAAAASAGNFFFAGGYLNRGSSSRASSHVDVFNLATGKWLTPVHMTKQRQALAGAAGNRVVAFAGGTDTYSQSNSKFYSTVDFFSAATSKYISSASLTSPVAHLSAAGAAPLVRGFATIGTYSYSSFLEAELIVTRTGILFPRPSVRFSVLLPLNAPQ